VPSTGSVLAAAAMSTTAAPADRGCGLRGLLAAPTSTPASKQRAGAGFSNAEADYGPSDLGHIDQRINAKDYRYRLKGKKPAFEREL
jgi:hypothetical protein